MSNAAVSIRELMSFPVAGIEADTLVKDAVVFASERAIHHLPIFQAKELVGLVCVCDLQDAPLESPISRYMRTKVVTASPVLSAAQAARLMSTYAVGSLVVIDAGEVCGLVTREDLLRSSPELEKLMPESHCIACGGHQHLRAGPDGGYLCVECLERSHGDNWFETGQGD